MSQAGCEELETPGGGENIGITELSEYAVGE
jgi:hypothetical protein